jgi:hypothetical protein
MEDLARCIGERRERRMRRMEIHIREAILSTNHPIVCMELIRMSVEFAEPICVTAHVPSPTGHETPFSVCVDCGGCICKWCYETAPRCEHGLCRPCAKKATRKCYWCNEEVVACARVCQVKHAARVHYSNKSSMQGTCEPSPHVLCPVCDYRSYHRCKRCTEEICPCCIDIHEVVHLHTRDE